MRYASETDASVSSRRRACLCVKHFTLILESVQRSRLVATPGGPPHEGKSWRMKPSVACDITTAARRRFAIGGRRFGPGCARGGRSTGGPRPRKREPTATISGKNLSGWTGTISMLSSPTEHGPGQSPVPHTQGRDQLPPISVAAFGRTVTALYSPQALTNDGNINAAFLCVASPRGAVGASRRRANSVGHSIFA
jgi:hypothetical protein